MTTALPLVCKLWLGVRYGMLPVRHLSPKIHMAVNYYWRQVARRLGWMAPLPTNKKEGAALHPGASKHSLQNDGRPDEHIGVWIGMWNIGSLSGKGETFVNNSERG